MSVSKLTKSGIKEAIIQQNLNAIPLWTLRIPEPITPA